MNITRVTPHVELLAHTPAPESAIAMAAKLCYSDADILELKQKVDASDCSKFIKKLVELGHESPMEHASFTFGIEGVSRALLAQITRHRIASFSVKSQRYVGVGDGFNYVIPPAICRLGAEAIEKFKHQMEQTVQWYKEWTDALGGNGESSNEDARFVLPNAAETKMVVTMNARELFHFFELRCCRRAQWEIRQVAWMMLDLVKGVAPILFENAGTSCIKGRCKEGKMTCGRPYKSGSTYEN